MVLYGISWKVEWEFLFIFGRLTKVKVPKLYLRDYIRPK